jgi:hypothetical protein
MTTEAPPAVPQNLAEQFAKAFAKFVDAVRAATKEAVLDPALSQSRSLLVWQTQDLPRLEKENAEVQNALALYLIGDSRSIIAQAALRRHIARELDGADLNFAGPERGQVLDQLETMVVYAAYQVCAAARVP